jgi:predicted ATPase
MLILQQTEPKTSSFQEPELSLRRASALAMAEISKHAPELAQIAIDAKIVPLIAPLVTHSDAKLKRQVCF